MRLVIKPNLVAKGLLIMVDMSVVLIIIINLTVTCAEYFPEFHELKLISRLNNFFDFDHNIFLFDSSADVDRFMNTSGGPVVGYSTPQSLYVFKNGNANELESLKEIGSKNAFVIVVPGSAKFDSNFNLLTRVKEIQLLKLDMKIGIFFQHTALSEDLRELFEWSWAQQIIKIFAATPSGSL